MLKLYANQLPAHLQQPLAGCYLIFGEEPLQKLEAIDAVRLAAKQQGFSERISLTADNQFDWQELESELNAMSLFAERRLIELDLVQQKLSTTANDCLKRLPNLLNPDIVLLIHGERGLNDVSKLVWFKQLQAQAVQVGIYQLDDKQSLQWLNQRARQLQLQLTPDAIALLQHHCASNLLAARQELEKLALSDIKQTIDATTLEQFLADHSHFTVFQLVDAVLAGQAEEALHRLQRLQQQDIEPIIIAWQLQKEVQQLQLLQQSKQPLNQTFKQLAIWPKRQPQYQKALARLSPKWLDFLLLELAAFDRLYKSGQLNNTNIALTHLVLLFITPVAKHYSLQQAQYD
ncbi:DNA polymerase III subunit delta [Rheinheimera sp. WS51]|uniref:DNA polymerase III subunit delta n=1 Tax=Rheinheimera sp. WS51 TaxID=3425886 RepID=UPI003D925725